MRLLAILRLVTNSCSKDAGENKMNQSTIVEYRNVLSDLSFDEFEHLKSNVLSLRVRFKELDVGELVCPIAEEVREKELCSSCLLKCDCPNFKI
jgi:hypothetical protein